MEAHAAGKLLHRMKTLTHPSLLVVDEIGYLPVSRTGAMHFFQLMSRRYEHASAVLTSDKSFEEWGEIFGDEVMEHAASSLSLFCFRRAPPVEPSNERRRGEKRAGAPALVSGF